jgi:small subunit ribosomal protein S8
MNDTIADMLARIQNAIMRKKEEVNVPNTKMNIEILKVLKQEEMISDFLVNEGERYVEVVLKYDENESVIASLKKVSKPGQRIYVTHNEIKPVMNGRGISIISTSSGIMSGAMAKSKKLGGELICQIW